ncbi:MAG: chorismate mutase [Angelakisella sp.]
MRDYSWGDVAMELSDARKRLDKIDNDMLELFERRMEVVSRISKYKESRGLPVRDEIREQEIIASVGEQVGEELAPYATRFTRAILEISRDYQREMREKSRLP